MIANSIQNWQARAPPPVVFFPMQHSVRWEYIKMSKDGEAGSKLVVIAGGGPAGLTAAYELYRNGIESIVLEKDSVVGGLARTVDYKGYHFDIGGHRFFTKVHAVEQMWKEILKEDFLTCQRLSRIYYNKKFFYYPLRAMNALSGLGIWNSFLIFVSYCYARLFPQKPEDTFEQWVSNRFGKRLYNIFFKTYTEKVWGIPCGEIRAEWAAQRIQGLSLLTALKNALLKDRNQSKGAIIKTLVDSFEYPKYGPGMMWKTVADLVGQNGSQVRLRTEVESIHWSGNRVESIGTKNNGRAERISGTDFISSMPVRELVRKLQPAAPQEVIDAANGLNYRDFLTIALIVNQKELFPDNWIYIHDPAVKVGRIQNFKNWSSYMVPDSNKTCLGLEYFCFEGDGLWNMSDADLVELGKREMETLGLARAADIEEGTVVRVPKAYPVYDSTYRQSLEVVRDFLSRLENLQLVGRNGMHKYNNQDHSMLTAMLAVKNILGENHDLWSVNTEEEYHEEVRAGSVPAVPQTAVLAATQPRVPVRRDIAAEVLIRTFARMDKLAFAVAVGTVCGLAILTATLFLILKGGRIVGPQLYLLHQYFIGYRISATGALIGLGYAFLWGFLSGWLFSYLRNLMLGLYLYLIRREAESSSLKNILDYI